MDVVSCAEELKDDEEQNRGDSRYCPNSKQHFVVNYFPNRPNWVLNCRSCRAWGRNSMLMNNSLEVIKDFVRFK